MKNLINKGAKFILAVIAAGGSAFAQSTDTIPSAQAALASGVTTAVGLAGTVAVAFAGIWVYRLVKKAGSKVAN